MIETQYAIDNRPSVTRYPRGSGYGAEILKQYLGEDAVGDGYDERGVLRKRGHPIEVGKGRVVKQHRQHTVQVSFVRVIALQRGSDQYFCLR